jgi:hypothetical protein
MTRGPEHYTDTANDIGVSDLACFDVTTATADGDGGGGSEDPDTAVTITNQTCEAWNGWKAKTKRELDDDEGDNLSNTAFQLTSTPADGTMTIDWVRDLDGDDHTPSPAATRSGSTDPGQGVRRRR